MASKRPIEMGLLVGILLLAAFLRLWALDDVPPGLEHDEVANWLIAQDILSGHHAIYFTTAYGHEPLWQYVQAGTIALLGDNWLGMRSVSVAFGLLSIVSAYLLARRLFGPIVALSAAAWSAVSFWHLFYSRVALRAISLPALSTLGAYFLWRGIDPQPQISEPSNFDSSRIRRYRDWALAGLLFGLSAYTYMAARALPFILVGFGLYLALFHRTNLYHNWRGLALTLMVAAVVAAPLALWLLTHPGAEYRIGEVSEPLNRLMAGDPVPVLDNAIALLKMWSIEGDPWDRQNIPGRPVFVEPLGALLFYGGFFIALLRFRRAEYGLVLIWLAGSLIPSLVTSVAPSSIRTINALAVVYIFPGIAIQCLNNFKSAPDGFVTRWLSGRLGHGILVLALALNLYLTARDYFMRWPDDWGVQFVFQTGLTAIARELDADPDDSPVAVAGLSVDTMDPPTFATTLRRRDLDVRWFSAQDTLVIPGGGDTSGLDTPVRFFVPRIVFLIDSLGNRLKDWGATVSGTGQYVRYDLADRQRVLAYLDTLTTTATLPDGGPVPPAASFGEQIELVGYEWLPSKTSPREWPIMLTYWRVIATPSPPLKVFVHLIPIEGERPVAQNDGLGSPPDTWRPGDLLIRWHTFELPADLSPGLYRLQVGWYNPETGERLPLVSDGAPVADRLLLMSVEVTAP